VTIALLLAFLGASLTITIAPGPDNLFILTQGIARGRRAAIITALGMCSGISIHTFAAALGISAIFATSALAFSVVKYAGALYLLYLAWLTIRHSGTLRLGQADVRPALALFKRGFIMNVLNPKVALFFLAFLPQFVDPQRGSVPIQMLLLGSLFMLQAVVLFTALGYFSGSIGGYLLARPRLARYLDGLTAGVFTLLALRLAFVER
jgi:threonine/homoserine/homoserine lactone efflux protein